MKQPNRRSFFAGMAAALAGAAALGRAPRAVVPVVPLDQLHSGGPDQPRRPTLAVRPAAGSVKRRG